MAGTVEAAPAESEESGIVERQAGRQARPGSKLARWFVLSGAVLGLVAAFAWWRYSLHYESSDDAQVDGHIDLVSTRISGTVTYLNPQIQNNQFVKAGTLIGELDPRDYQTELERAEADLRTRVADASSARLTVPITNASAFGQLRAVEAARAEAESKVETERANLLAAQHKLQQDEAISARVERDRVRYLALVEKREISRSDYDARETEATAASQMVAADAATITAIEQNIAQARQAVVQRQAQVEAARAAPDQVADAQARSRSAGGHVEQARAYLHMAQLNLSYTKIYAPVSGVIGRKTIELGHRLQPGQSLLAIVPLDDIWITANFKETQLKYMRPGQPVKIRVDTFDRDYQGTVENLAGAAGPVFSLFPPENATGNYVKVVQRFPVRIRLNKDQDPEHWLRPGMSVEPTVTIR